MPYDQLMHQALALAREAGQAGEVPVGALVVDGHGQVLGRGRNRRELTGDPLAHAEVEALRQAASLGGWQLSDCTLVVSLEPCPMCAGAALQAHLGRIVFGAWDAKLGACGSVWDLPRDPHIGQHPEIVGGVLEADCASLLSDFFQDRRHVGKILDDKK
ncbi:tRNA-specific adenosine deaminase [Bifidobacterium aemilianum]|uniref:tRNA-specific adenosine deaminase n=1 Tax=Bifidobacterium aemilianum TaxID=2493120 RepID=A0A366K7G5_9BIFI|nr:nucleoside deaminase [Bifidobacterium aemilianum]RBP97192.1 tRNA-specific adenosine deaminase [Bifidobacterium aemilianum]